MIKPATAWGRQVLGRSDAPKSAQIRPQTSHWPSSVLEVRVEDVWPPMTHLRALDVRGAAIELGLVPLAFLELIPPLHALLCCNARLRLVLEDIQASELLNLQVLARILRRIGMHLVRESGYSQADVVCGLRGLVCLRHIQAMVIGHSLLPLGGVGRLLVSIHVHVEMELVLVGLVHLLLGELQLVCEVEGLWEGSH